MAPLHRHLVRRQVNQNLNDNLPRPNLHRLLVIMPPAHRSRRGRNKRRGENRKNNEIALRHRRRIRRQISQILNIDLLTLSLHQG